MGDARGQAGRVGQRVGLTGIEEADHRRAHRLAEGWHAAGLPVDVGQVETNFVQVRVDALGLTRDEALARLREGGVGLSSTIHPTVVRAVTHLDLDDADIERAIELAPHALGIRAAA